VSEATTRTRALAAAATLAVAGVLAIPGTTLAGTGPSAGSCGVFPAHPGPPGAPSADDQTAWNQDVSQTPRHRRSADYLKRIRKLGGNQSLHPDFGGDGAYGIPYTVVGQAEPLVDVAIGPQGYPDESEFGSGTAGPPSAPIPLDAPIEGFGDNGDRHVLVVREGACDLWEMYRSFPRPADDEWRADSTALFDLASGARHPETWTSADAAGLPILPGLVRYDEVAAGSVDHAIRATFASTRRGYVHPAVHYASDRCARSLPPMGLRLRLKRSFYEAHLDDFAPSSQARPIFEALYRHGLIVADNGSNWYFTGAADPRWDDEELNALKDVPGRAFIAVQSEAAVTTPC
jgi:hypothetical protein